MRIKFIRFFLIFLCLSCIFTLPSEAANSIYNQKTLKGIKHIGIIIESVSERAHNKGVSESNLYAMVVNRLKEKGIRVESRENILETPGSPVLDLHIQDAYLQNEDMFLLSIGLAFFQDVILDRDKSLGSFGVGTWSDGWFGIVSAKGVDKKINSVVNSLVDRFVNAYLSVN